MEHVFATKTRMLQLIVDYFLENRCNDIRHKVRIAVGESVINCPSPLHVLKNTHEHSCN